MKRLLLFLLFFSILKSGYTQTLSELMSIPTGHEYVSCGLEGSSENIGDYFMPRSDDTLRVLIVFCNFPSPSGNYDPYYDVNNDLILLQHWSQPNAQTKPIWADSIICPTTTNIWHPSMTGMIKEASMGKYFLIGDVYEDVYIFQNQVSYYTDTSRQMGAATRELLEAIDDNVDYSQYDKFDPLDLDEDNNRREPDGRVDFIFLAFRFNNSGSIEEAGGYSGIATLGGHTRHFGRSGPEYITLDGKRIYASFPGSGAIADIHNRWEFTNLIHEYFQHYTYGGVHHDLGSWNINGGTIPNAHDRNELEWTSQGTGYIPTSNTTITLTDYVTQGDYIKIPRESGDYYIEYRRRLNFYSTQGWHTWKWRVDAPELLMQRDSGVVIYKHVYDPKEVIFSPIDARGKFDWEQCSGNYNKITQEIFINTFHPVISDRYSGMATNHLYNQFVKDADCELICMYGGCYDTRSYIGSAGDTNSCFDIGYNQVYSPWSNPPIVPTNSSDSLAIELIERSNGSMVVKVYFTNLIQSAPAKPQDLALSRDLTNIFDPLSTYYPKLDWSANLEPDIEEYNIYRGQVLIPGQEPSSYDYIATTSSTSYIDDEILLYPSQSDPCAGENTYTCYAYKITAVDDTEKESVKSEKDTVYGYLDPCLPESPRPNLLGIEAEIPTEFDLKQNYPNPFNPTTNIQYDLPIDNFVTIKVYDITGRVVTTLINEFKNAGRYIVSFNASSLSSGIYFYKIEAGNFVETKRMVLIK